MSLFTPVEEMSLFRRAAGGEDLHHATKLNPRALVQGA